MKWVHKPTSARSDDVREQKRCREIEYVVNIEDLLEFKEERELRKQDASCNFVPK